MTNVDIRFQLRCKPVADTLSYKKGSMAHGCRGCVLCAMQVRHCLEQEGVCHSGCQRGVKSRRVCLVDACCTLRRTLWHRSVVPQCCCSKPNLNGYVPLFRASGSRNGLRIFVPNLTHAVGCVSALLFLFSQAPVRSSPVRRRRRFRETIGSCRKRHVRLGRAE